MKVTQSVINDLFALISAVFSIPIYQRETTFKKKKIVENYCKILSVFLKNAFHGFYHL